jgi:hypothetical protein
LTWLSGVSCEASDAGLKATIVYGQIFVIDFFCFFAGTMSRYPDAIAIRSAIFLVYADA